MLRSTAPSEPSEAPLALRAAPVIPAGVGCLLFLQQRLLASLPMLAEAGTGATTGEAPGGKGAAGSRRMSKKEARLAQRLRERQPSKDQQMAMLLTCVACCCVSSRCP